MEIALLAIVAIGITAIVVGREVAINRRARARLSAPALELELRPPWSKPELGEGAGRRSAETGSWAAWYRDGRLGAYLVTVATLRPRSERQEIEVAEVSLSIVQPTARDATTLASVQVPLQPVASGENWTLSMTLNGHIDQPGPAPGPGAILLLSISLSKPPTLVERELCPVEHKLIVSGGRPPERPSGD